MSKAYYMRIPKEIIHSSIWLESPDVCKLWITLLAMKGPDHAVHKSLRMIAEVARLEKVVVQRAMERLMGPDPDSSNPANEGRRVKKLKEGGYLLLNGEYWDRMMLKEYNREAKAEERARKPKEAGGNNPTLNERLMEKEINEGKRDLATGLPVERIDDCLV